MSFSVQTGLLLIAAALSGCSWESAKRTGYETLESMRIQQCLDRRDDPDCPTERQRYPNHETEQPSSSGE